MTGNIFRGWLWNSGLRGLFACLLGTVLYKNLTWRLEPRWSCTGFSSRSLDNHISSRLFRKGKSRNTEAARTVESVHCWWLQVTHANTDGSGSEGERWHVDSRWGEIRSGLICATGMTKAAANGVIALSGEIASHSPPAFGKSTIEQVGDKTVWNSALGGTKEIQVEGSLSYWLVLADLAADVMGLWTSWDGTSRMKSPVTGMWGRTRTSLLYSSEH